MQFLLEVVASEAMVRYDNDPRPDGAASSNDAARKWATAQISIGDDFQATLPEYGAYCRDRPDVRIYPNANEPAGSIPPRRVQVYWGGEGRYYKGWAIEVPEAHALRCPHMRGQVIVVYDDGDLQYEPRQNVLPCEVKVPCKVPCKVPRKVPCKVPCKRARSALVKIEKHARCAFCSLPEFHSGLCAATLTHTRR
jgi:hypothetical protein